MAPESVEDQNDLATDRFHFLLADDDYDDRHFFEIAIKKLYPRTRFSFVTDGEKLMDFLNKNIESPPDVLFLDLNMPRKNGSECLIEIRNNKNLDRMAVIIYSTASHNEVADVLH